MRWASVVGLSLLGLGLALGPPAHSAESAKGVYLLGFRDGFAGVMPGPGAYLQNDFYVYSGSADADVTVPIGAGLLADVDATVVADIMTGLYVLPGEVLGGSLAINATLPVGWQKIEAGAELTVPGPIPPLSRGISDDDLQIGDPLLGAAIGWHSGNFHWQIATFVNIPVGSWERSRIVNMGFNRWAVDVTAAGTWFDPEQGWEASAAIGVTFNGKNLDTDYETGTELHVEAEASKVFASGARLGLAGYFYDQLTADDGPLGDFKGRVAAIGPVAGYTIPLADRALTTNLRWYHEFDARNRLEGDGFYFTASIPLQAEAQQ